MTAPKKTATTKSAGRQPRKGARKLSARRKTQEQATVRVPRATRMERERNPSAAPVRPSKKGAILALLQRPDGAAISDLIEATGWQVHSVRAALTGFRKEGKDLVRAKDEAGVTHYRLAAEA